VSELRISEIQIIPVKPRDGLVAFASCIVNNAFYIGNIAVYTCPSSESGFRLVFPEKVLPNGKKVACVHPINRNTGEVITKAIANEFHKVLAKAV